MDLLGRLSNPPGVAEALVAHGSEWIVGSGEGVETARIRPSGDSSEELREEMGRLANPPQQRLSPTAVDDLIAA